MIMNYKIIDAHFHPNLDRPSYGRYGMPDSMDEMVADMKRAGISQACGSVLGTYTGIEDVRRLNAEALELAGLYGDFYVPGVHVHAGYVRESCEELEKAHAAGVKLVGELVPYWMGWDAYLTKDSYPIYDLAQNLGMAINIHLTSDEDIDALVQSFPRLAVIKAHPGEFEEYTAHIERMKRFDNAYLDLSGTGLFRNRMLRYGIDRAGADRILFGTDYPICNPAMQVQGILYENLTSAENEAIFSGNVTRLLGL
jgi:hypothetical protein